jgi:hypothetical protein
MSVHLKLEDESGRCAADVPDLHEYFPRISALLEDDEKQLLGFIDPHGVTVFNRLQVDRLLLELHLARARATYLRVVEPAAIRHHLDQLIRLAERCKAEADTYLRFQGDERLAGTGAATGRVGRSGRNRLRAWWRLATNRTPLAIGVGQGGCNAVARLNRGFFDIAAINSDHAALVASRVATKIEIGRSLVCGRGVKSDPALGRVCAMEAEEELRSLVRDRSAVAIVTCLGGGTGSGAAPFIAQLAADAGAMTVAIVSLPLRFEGERRAVKAEKALFELRRVVSATFVFSGDDLLPSSRNQSILALFSTLDSVLAHAAAGFIARVTGGDGWGPGVVPTGNDAAAVSLSRVKQWLAETS